MPRYDLDLVKQAAEGRWLDILCSVSSVDASALDGRHTACPKCGGSDRFRSLDDFAKTGAVLCNQCFDSKNGDGFAAIQWLNDCDFGTAIDLVAKQVGVKPQKRKKTDDPFEHLEELKWNDVLAALWCQKKEGIKPESLKRIGAKFCRYRKQYTVFAIPVWGPQLDSNAPAGWILYRSDGGDLPKYKKGSIDWVKVKLSEGSTQGVVCNLDDWKSDEVLTWWKLEGSTDWLAAASQDWPSGHSFFTTANGAKEKPLDWIIEHLADCPVNVCHDADKPGQEGATWIEQQSGARRAGWCPRLAERSSDVRNVTLPFSIEPTKGPDVRDFFVGGGTVATLIDRASEAEAWETDAIEEETAIPVELDNAKSLATANLNYYRREQMRSLVYWRGEWYRYKGSRYEKIEPDHLRLRVREFIEGYFERCWKSGEDDRDSVRNVTMGLVNNVVEALKIQCLVSPSVEPDSWLESGPGSCIALQNKILSLQNLFDRKEDYLFDHSKDWFSFQALPYSFDPKAQCPEWEKFLWEVFDDPESIAVLQQWFGYLLLRDCHLEKMLFIIGPKRSGKGTIIKVMMSLFGENQVASPTLGDLIGGFTLHGLLGRTVALIPDARLSQRADREAITERLLSMVSNDPQQVDRKHMSVLNGIRMDMRFTLFSNKLPDLKDSTGVMTDRGIYLLMKNSFLGKEDYGLFDRLKKELPGILNWAIAGRYKLMSNGRLLQPESAAHLVRGMRIAMAPVSQFLQERTVFGDNPRGILASDLHEAYCRWAKNNGLTKQIGTSDFERKAFDAMPSLKIEYRESGGFEDRVFPDVSLKA